MNGAVTEDTGFRHEALFYKGDEEYLAGTIPFIAEAANAGEPILVAVGEDRARLLRSALPGPARSVRFVDMTKLGRNPARIIPAWREFAAANHGGAMRGIGELSWPGRSDEELVECRSHESLLNLVFSDGTRLRLLCPFDAAGLTDEALEGARHTHPILADSRTEWSSDAYLSPDEAPGPFEGQLPEPSSAPDELNFSGEAALSEVRGMVGRRAERADLRSPPADKLILAASELVANSIRHGGGRGRLRVWREPDALVVEVVDAGHIYQPLVGRVRPGTEHADGRGLWIVNQLCDLVQIRSGEPGTIVRAQVRTG